MAASHFHLSLDGALSPIRETRFESEDQVRRILADHPQLLGWGAGDDTAPAWLTLARQTGDEGGDGEMSFLYLDAEGAPTLAAVVLSASPTPGHEVIGRIMEAAANARSIWPLSRLHAAFATRYANGKTAADAALQKLVGEKVDPASYWRSVETNLEQGRMRLVFVVDQMPADLEPLVRFLSTQLTSGDVYALEVQRSASAGGQILTTSVHGRSGAVSEATVAPQRRPAGGGAAAQGRNETTAGWLKSVRASCDEDEAAVLDDLARWMREQYGVTALHGASNPSLGLAVKEAGKDRSVFGLTPNKKAAIYLGALAASATYESDDSRQGIVNQIMAAGVPLNGASLKGDIRIGFRDLSDPDVRARMLTVLDDVIETLRLRESRGLFGA